MIKKKINQMIKEGKLRILDKNNVTEFKKDLEQEAELLILMGYDVEEAIKKAHYRLLPKRYTIQDKRKRIKPLLIGLNIEPMRSVSAEDLFIDDIMLRQALQSILTKDEQSIVEYKMAGKGGHNNFSNQSIADLIGRSRQYVQYKLREIQEKLKKHF